MRGDGAVFQRGSSWWIVYYVRGKRYREPAGKTEAAAKRRLRARLGEVYSGRFVGPEEERVLVDQLLDALVVHLETKGAASAGSVRSHLKPVRERFGHLRALEVTTAMVEEFARERLADGYARSSVNKQIQPLQQAFNLARKQGRLTRVPYMPKLKVDNARQGFFEHDEFERVAANLPEPIADIARFGYLTGWRKGEILPLRWEAIDRSAREVRLRTSKNGHGRVLPLAGDLWEIIERRWAARRFLGVNSVPAISEHVFHVKGRPIGQFDGTWKRACRLAGCPGKLFHDLRRTAVRNMVRADVPQSVAMAISGHRTISMFLRYNVTSDEDVLRAVLRTQEHVKGKGRLLALPAENSHRTATIGQNKEARDRSLAP